MQEQSYAFSKGWNFYAMGKSINDCPYTDIQERTDFMCGYVTALCIEDDKNPLLDGTFRQIS